MSESVSRSSEPTAERAAVIDRLLTAATTMLPPAGDTLEIARLRRRIEGEIRQRVQAALGPHADPDTAQLLERLYAGSVVNAGIGLAAHARHPRTATYAALRILNR